MTEKQILEAFYTECAKSKDKHPYWPNDVVYAAAIVGEEYGEVMKECVKIVGNEPDASMLNLRKELKQLGAMVLRMLANLPDDGDKSVAQEVKEWSEKIKAENQ